MINLEQSEKLALNLEQATQDKAVLQKRLQNSLEKEGKYYYCKYKHSCCFYIIFF